MRWSRIRNVQQFESMLGFLFFKNIFYETLKHGRISPTQIQNESCSGATANTRADVWFIQTKDKFHDTIQYCVNQRVRNKPNMYNVQLRKQVYLIFENRQNSIHNLIIFEFSSMIGWKSRNFHWPLVIILNLAISVSIWKQQQFIEAYPGAEVCHQSSVMWLIRRILLTLLIGHASMSWFFCKLENLINIWNYSKTSIIRKVR